MKDKTLNKLPRELIEKPYHYIRNYYEMIYPHIGDKVFSILSLIPISLIIPKIPRGKKLLKQKITLLLISPPGTGKSSIANEFEKITFDPIALEYITDSRLFYELSKKDRATLIISDIAKIFSNEMIIKQIENAVGEDGYISRNTMLNREEDTKKLLDVVAYFSGTPENLINDRIRDGLLARTSALIIVHTLKEHEEILNYVNDNIGEESKENMNYIPYYYNILDEIQNDSNNKYPPVQGYIISKEIKKEIGEFIKPLVKQTFIQFGVESIRELEQAYRFLLSHAVLNYFNREKIKGKIVITSEDLKVAKFLIKREIETKHKIIATISERNKSNLKTMNDLRQWLYHQKIIEKRNINPEAEFLLRGMIKNLV